MQSIDEQLFSAIDWTKEEAIKEILDQLLNKCGCASLSSPTVVPVPVATPAAPPAVAPARKAYNKIYKQRQQLRKEGCSDKAMDLIREAEAPLSPDDVAPDDTDPLVVPLPKRGSIIKTLIYEHMSRRCPETHRMIHQRVLDSYGNITERSTYRTCTRLVKTGLLVHISRGINKYGKPQPGGYVRHDNPLLREPNGMAYLIEMLADQE